MEPLDRSTYGSSWQMLIYEAEGEKTRGVSAEQLKVFIDSRIESLFSKAAGDLKLSEDSKKSITKLRSEYKIYSKSLLSKTKGDDLTPVIEKLTALGKQAGLISSAWAPSASSSSSRSDPSTASSASAPPSPPPAAPKGVPAASPPPASPKGASEPSPVSPPLSKSTHTFILVQMGDMQTMLADMLRLLSVPSGEISLADVRKKIEDLRESSAALSENWDNRSDFDSLPRAAMNIVGDYLGIGPLKKVCPSVIQESRILHIQESGFLPVGPLDRTLHIYNVWKYIM